MKNSIISFVMAICLCTACSTTSSSNYAGEENTSAYAAESDFITTGLGSATITQYKGSDKDVNIPGILRRAKVKKIGSGAFRAERLTSVNIPDGVTDIRNNAFSNNQLTMVIIPESVTKVGIGAFTDNHLTSITIPGRITVIQSDAFSNNQLKNINIPERVKSIGVGAFANNQLTSVTIPNKVTIIEAMSFASNELTIVIFPDSVKTIGRNAFRDNEISRITIGRNVKMFSDSFDYDFAQFYQSQGRTAGTYAYRNGMWQRE